MKNLGFGFFGARIRIFRGSASDFLELRFGSVFFRLESRSSIDPDTVFLKLSSALILFGRIHGSVFFF